MVSRWHYDLQVGTLRAMNYAESLEIKNKIAAASQVLINCHHMPDADSVGSALAMYQLLTHMGKNVRIVCPSQLPQNFMFLEHSDKIETVDFSTLDYSQFDLFITLDTGSWNRVTGSNEIEKPTLPIIVIDHHVSNTRYGEIHLIVPEAAATCVVLYFFLQDLGYRIDRERDYPEFAQPLLTGIIGDTGAFRFPEADELTLTVSLDLMKFTSKDKIIFNLYQRFDIRHIQLWGEFLSNIHIDTEHKFVWSAVSKDVYKKYGNIVGAKSELADMLFANIEGTDFGAIAIEDDECISVSFRSRTGVDVAKLASTLGGGGHTWASAARITGMPYNEGMEKILEACREFTRQ